MRGDTNDIPLGTHLRILRVQAGYSIRELSKKIGLHSSSLARLESGEIAHPSPELLQRLADVLGADSAEMLTYVGVRPELPEPRAYFRRKYGFTEEETDEITQLVEKFRSEHKLEGGEDHDQHQEETK